MAYKRIDASGYTEADNCFAESGLGWLGGISNTNGKEINASILVADGHRYNSFSSWEHGYV